MADDSVVQAAVDNLIQQPPMRELAIGTLMQEPEKQEEAITRLMQQEWVRDIAVDRLAAQLQEAADEGRDNNKRQRIAGEGVRGRTCVCGSNLYERKMEDTDTPFGIAGILTKQHPAWAELVGTPLQPAPGHVDWCLLVGRHCSTHLLS